VIFVAAVAEASAMEALIAGMIAEISSLRKELSE
jgi:hypothetical protein